MWREHFKVSFPFSRIYCQVFAAFSYITIYMTVPFIQGKTTKSDFTAKLTWDLPGQLETSNQPRRYLDDIVQRCLTANTVIHCKK